MDYEWIPVRRDKVTAKVLSNGRVELLIMFDPNPDQMTYGKIWLDHFWPKLMITPLIEKGHRSKNRFKLELVLEIEQHNLEAAVKEVDGLVSSANSHFEQELPNLLRQSAVLAAQMAEQQKTLDAFKARVEKFNSQPDLPTSG